MNNYNNYADLNRRLKRNSDHDKNRYVKKNDVYKSTTDFYFTNNKFIIFWAQKR
jgi:hypothetical protein